MLHSTKWSNYIILASQVTFAALNDGPYLFTVVKNYQKIWPVMQMLTELLKRTESVFISLC